MVLNINEAWDGFKQSADELLAEARNASSSGRCIFVGVATVCQSGQAHLLAQYLSSACKRAIREQYISPWWQACGGILSYESEDFSESHCATLAAAFEEVHQGLLWHCKILEDLLFYIQMHCRLRPTSALHDMTTEFCSYTAAALVYEADVDLIGSLSRCYCGGLRVFLQAIEASENIEGTSSLLEYMESTAGEGPEFEFASKYATIGHRPADAVLVAIPSAVLLQKIAQTLRMLGLEELSRQAYKTAICQMTHLFLSRASKGELERAVLPSAKLFVDAVIVPFLLLLLGSEVKDEQAVIKIWRAQLHDFVHRVVGGFRIADIFDIVTSYPDSSEAVTDLQQCMAVCSLQARLVRVYRHACSTRLHIPGAKTTDIIEFYVHSIKILRELDATGILLEAVSGPTRQYLQTRKDAIRCIVSAMTDDSAMAGESLYDELHRPAQEDEDDEEKETDAFALQQWQTWVPEPVNADLKHTAKAQRMHDIISMLVHIYGSKDLFINEYRGMLAERLLAKSDYDTDTEIRTLEHLKKRFGENNLHSCEVMMKDLADSKRLYNTIKAMPEGLPSPVRGKRSKMPNTLWPASATIISAHFWPPLQDEALQLHPTVENCLEEYAAKFWIAKQPRKLVWMQHLGTVELNLKVNNVSRDFTVSPFEATILMFFRIRSTWSEESLAEIVGTVPEVLRRKAGFWVKHGVLSEDTDRRGTHTYTRASHLSAQEVGDEVVPIAMDEDEGESALVSQEEQLKQEMAIYEQYILGMLSTFEAGLPLDRIHNMLKMFVPEQAYDKTVDQLSAFLGQLVTEEKLLASANVYTKR